MSCYICGSRIHSSHNVMVDDAGMRHAGCKPPAKQEKPPLGLKPHHCWVYSRISEIMRAIIRYEDAGMAVPPEWCSELRGHLVAPNDEITGPRSGSGALNCSTAIASEKQGKPNDH